MHPQEAIKLRKRLRREILRADQLAWLCDEQKADKSLSMDERLDAQNRAVLAIATRKDLQHVLQDLETKLQDG